MKAVRWMPGMPAGARLLCVVAALGLALTGCDKAVTGVAVRDPNAPVGKILDKSAVGDVLASLDDIDKIMGATDLSVVLDKRELIDNSDRVSNPSCVGAAYGGQQEMYGNSGYTAVRHQYIRQPGPSSAYIVEQVVTLYPSGEQAKNMLADAKTQLQDCAGALTTHDSDGDINWNIGDVESDDTSITQTSTADGMGGGCEHSMAVAANVVAEAWACGNYVVDEATAITAAIVKNVDDK